MAKKIICTTCGKEVEAINSFELEKGKVQCEDCAKPLYCKKCGKRIYHKEPIAKMASGRFCESCLFPEESGISYEHFLGDYDAYKKEVTKHNRKVSIAKLLIVLGSVLLYSSIVMFILISLKKGQVAVFIDLPIWLIITFLVMNKFVKKEELLTTNKFYGEKFPQNTTVRIDNIYRKYARQEPLTKKELTIIRDDFLERSTVAVPCNSAGKYRVKGDLAYIKFNGFLVINPQTKDIQMLALYQSAQKSYDIEIDNAHEIRNIGCIIEPVKGKTSPVAATAAPVAPAKEPAALGGSAVPLKEQSVPVAAAVNQNSLTALYQKLQSNRSALSASEIEQVVKDFTARAKRFQTIKEADFTAEFSATAALDAPITNGLLLVRENTKQIFLFQINQPSGQRFDFHLAVTDTAYCFNGTITKKEQVISTAAPQAVQQPMSLEEKIEKIERINTMQQNGIITKEEFEKLKKEIMESQK